jgi:hypothetical protein
MVLEPVVRYHREGDREGDELLTDGVVERSETGKRHARVVHIDRGHEQGQGEGERRVEEPDRAVELALIARVARRGAPQDGLHRTRRSKQPSADVSDARAVADFLARVF